MCSPMFYYKTQATKGKRFKNEKAQLEFYLEQDKDIGGWWTVNRVVSGLFRPLTPLKGKSHLKYKIQWNADFHYFNYKKLF